MMIKKNTVKPNFLGESLRKLFICLIMLLFASSAYSQTRVNGNGLYDPNGQRIIVRGIEQVVYANNVPMINEIAKTGANCVRLLPVFISDSDNTPATFDALLAACKANGMVAMISPILTWQHASDQLAWTWYERDDIYNVLMKYKDYTILDGVMEQNYSDRARWETTCKTAINRLRAKGYTQTINMMSTDFGRGAATVLQKSAVVFNHDPLKNVMFNVQSYWSTCQDGWCATDSQFGHQGTSTEIIKANLAKLAALPYVVNIGTAPWAEGGGCNTGFVDYQTAMQECQRLGLGYLNWDWHNPYEWSHVYAMTTSDGGGIYGSWVNLCTNNNNTDPCRRNTPYGCDYGYNVAIGNPASIQKTSVKTCFMQGGTGCTSDDASPSIPSGVTASAISSTGFNLTWNASTDNVGVTNYYVYNGTTLLGVTLQPTLSLSNLTPGQTYAIKVTANDGGSNESAPSEELSVTTLDGSDQVVYEYWSNVSGTQVSLIPLGTTPTGTLLLNSLEAPIERGDNFGARIRAILKPTVSGNYTFYVASDDHSQLFLSTNNDPANKVKIAEVADWTTPREWLKLPSQKSASVSLVAGNEYYVEILHKEGTGGDHVAIGWTGPGISEITVIGSPYIKKYVAQPGDTSTPSNLVASNITNTSFTLNWNAATGNVASYNVYFGTELAGNTATTSFNATGLTASTTYSVTVKAVDSNGNLSAASQALEVTTTGSQPSTGQTSLDLNFTDPADADRFAYIFDTGGEVVKTVANGEMKLVLNKKEWHFFQVWIDPFDFINNPYLSFKIKTDKATPIRIWIKKGEGNTNEKELYNQTIPASSEYQIVQLSFTDLAPLVGDMSELGIDIGGYQVPPAVFAGTVYMDYFRLGEAAKPVAEPVDTSAPTAPSNLVASSVTTNSFALSWTASTDNVGVTGYKVYNNDVLVFTTTETTAFITGLNPSTTYSIKVSAGDKAGNATESVPLNVTTKAPAPVTVTREVWANVTGKTLSSIPVNTAPTSTSQLTSLEAPANTGDNYGSRIRAFITPAISGYYTFYMAADEQAELWLSASENPAQKTKIAEVTKAVKSREWTKSPAQKSVERVLLAGVKYYIEVLHKDTKGTDHLAIGWTGPGIKAITVIDGNVLSPYTTGESRPADNTGTGFFMKNAKIYDANGKEFIPIGYNGAVFWQDETCMKNSLDDVARTGANAIRLVAVTPAPANSWSWASRLENHRALVASSVANNLVPMLEMHDGTCGSMYENDPEGKSLKPIVDYWVSPGMVQLCKDYEKQLIVNIANEWGHADHLLEWKNAYKTAIGRMRAAGIKNMIVIDAGGNCGQNPNGIITHAQEIINSDPEKNIVFSIHMYAFWYSGTTNAAGWRYQVEAKLQEFKNNNIPIMVGEFGWEGPSDISYDPRVVMSKAAELGYGWFYWAWFDQPQHANYYGIVKDPCRGYNSDADLSVSGAAIVNGANGVRARSKTASIYPNARVTSKTSLIVDGSHVSVSPNPSAGRDLSIVISGFEKNEDVTLQMVNLQGHTVYNRIVRTDNLGVGRVEIPTSSITSGLYLIKAGGKLIRDVKKVIISK